MDPQERRRSQARPGAAILCPQQQEHESLLELARWLHEAALKGFTRCCRFKLGVFALEKKDGAQRPTFDCRHGQAALSSLVSDLVTPWALCGDDWSSAASSEMEVRAAELHVRALDLISGFYVFGWQALSSLVCFDVRVRVGTSYVKEAVVEGLDATCEGTEVEPDEQLWPCLVVLTSSRCWRVCGSAKGFWRTRGISGGLWQPSPNRSLAPCAQPGVPCFLLLFAQCELDCLGRGRLPWPRRQRNLLVFWEECARENHR